MAAAGATATGCPFLELELENVMKTMKFWEMNAAADAAADLEYSELLSAVRHKTELLSKAEAAADEANCWAKEARDAAERTWEEAARYAEACSVSAKQAAERAAKQADAGLLMAAAAEKRARKAEAAAAEARKAGLAACTELALAHEAAVAKACELRAKKGNS